MANNQKTKNVRLDNDVMKTLAKARQDFESPNDCLKRLLSKNPCKNETKEPNSDIDESETPQEEAESK